MPGVETWLASAVRYEDDARIYFHLKKLYSKLVKEEV